MAQLTDEAVKPLTCCYACGVGLEPEFEGTTQEEALAHEQWGNALVVILEGGYGMFIDPIPGGDEQPDAARGLLQCEGAYKVVICHACAHSLCENVPWMQRLVDPVNSHAHRVDRDWSGHTGWDLPHRPRP